MRTFILIVSVLFSAEASDAALTELVSKLQAKYEKINSLEAKFEQTYESARFSQTQTVSGTMMVKKPGKMRWNYSKPKGKVLVSDGSTITMYDPSDRQAIVSARPKDQNLPAAIAFLSGSGDLKKSFDFSWVSKPQNDQAILKAVPKKSEPNVKELEFTVSVQNPLITGTTVIDELGGRSKISFTSIKLDKNIPDREFNYQIPKQATIITQ